MDEVKEKCSSCQHYEEFGAFPHGVGKCHWDDSTTTEIDYCDNHEARKPPGPGLRLNGISTDADVPWSVVFFFSRKLTKDELSNLHDCVGAIVAGMNKE